MVNSFSSIFIDIRLFYHYTNPIRYTINEFVVFVVVIYNT
jgi:hypothetical protein